MPSATPWHLIMPRLLHQSAQLHAIATHRYGEARLVEQQPSPRKVLSLLVVDRVEDFAD